MSMQPNPKKTKCEKCSGEFMGDFTTMGIASLRHKLCGECRKIKTKKKEETTINKGHLEDGVESK